MKANQLEPIQPKQNQSLSTRSVLLGLLSATMLAGPVLGDEAKMDPAKDDPFVKDAAAKSGEVQEEPAELLDAQARILFARGETDAAIELQKKAVARAEQTLEKSRANLARYTGQPLEGAALAAKLKTIIIPKIDFENASLADAVIFLRHMSVQLDVSEKDPGKRGVNFVLPNELQDKNIASLRLANMPLDGVLKAICELTGTRYEVTDEEVTIRR